MTNEEFATKAAAAGFRVQEMEGFVYAIGEPQYPTRFGPRPYGLVPFVVFEPQNGAAANCEYEGQEEPLAPFGAPVRDRYALAEVVRIQAATLGYDPEPVLKLVTSLPEKF